MSNLNYSNYVYLFVDPHEVTITNAGASFEDEIGKDFFVNPEVTPDDPTALPAATTFLHEKAGDLEYKTFNVLPGYNGDYPDFYIPYGTVSGFDLTPIRIQSPGVNSSQEGMNVKEVFNNYAGHTAIYKKTNDFGSDPTSRWRFRIRPEGVEAFYAQPDPSTFYYVSPQSYDAELQKVSTVLQNAKNESRNLTQDPNRLLSFRRPKYTNKNKKIQEFGNEFTVNFDLMPMQGFKYKQNSYLVLSEEFGLIPDVLMPLAKTFFQNLYQDIQSDAYGGYIMDCSTKFGVPYDIRTVIDKKADKKAAGVVKEPQPTYEQVYNYYDPQYEPVIIETLEGNIVTERSLPNIYDFLYLPVQNQTLKAFIGLPSKYNVSVENINLSSLNTYLDIFSRDFIKYTFSYPTLTLTDAAEQYIPQSMRDNNETNNPFDSFFFTNKSVVMNMLKSKILPQALIGGGLSDRLYEAKATSTPLWQEELKAGLYFSEKSLQYFNQAKDHEAAFPFYFKLNIPVEPKGPVAKLLSQNDLLDSINTHAAGLSVPNADINAYRPISTVGNFYGGLINGYNPEHFNLYNRLKLKTFNLHFITKPSVEPNDDIQPLTLLPLSEQPPDYYKSDLFLDTIRNISLQAPKNVFIYTDKELQQSPSGIPAILNALKTQKFINDLKDLFSDSSFFRTPKDIHDGKLAHQETIMYEIAKYKMTEDGVEDFVQNIFLPISDQSKLTYYDTQVEPYKEYFYKIFAHKVVVGTKYRPADLDDQGNKIDFIYNGISIKNPDAKPIFRFNYEVEPYFKFIRVPYYNTDVVNIETDEVNHSSIEDLPPLPPQVNIVPFRNVEDKIMILLNHSSGEIKAKHQSILDSDDANFIKAYASQGLDYKKKDALLTFGNDDQGGVFEAFRVENLPNTYKDMQKDSSFTRRRINARSPSLIENIRPNTEYYYTFRTQDVHGKISNPTDFYKVVMVHQQGTAPYLKIELINLAEERFKQQKEKLSYTKNFKKYLHLKVTGDQTILEAYPSIEYTDEGYAIGDYKTQHVQMGAPSATSDGVFGNKYKLRITSKQTGRKIDINFRVKRPENIINETQD